MRQALDLFMDSCRNASYVAIAPKLSKKQQEVYNALKNAGRATLFELAEKMGVPAHCVCGRLSELVGKEQVRVVDYKINQFSKKENSIYECIS